MSDRAWDDGVAGGWRDPANWTSNGVPAPGDLLTIASARPRSTAAR